MKPYALPCGCDGESSCNECTLPTCRVCPQDSPDAPAITTDSYVVPGANGHVLVEQVCQDCAARATGTIDYVEVAPWMETDTKAREPGCRCHKEEGDSPCPVHGDESDDDFHTEVTRPMPTLTDVELRRLQLKEVAFGIWAVLS